MKTHWKKQDDPNYLGAYSLMDGTTKELTATIEKIVIEDVKNERGTEKCRVMYLKGQKPMILNTTNSKAIEKALGTPYIEDWANKSIIIYVARIKAFGDEIDALRIKPSAPKQQTLPELKKTDTENFNKIVVAIKNGYDIAAIRTKWSITKEVETLLFQKANETV